jgi:hypothetical protein
MADGGMRITDAQVDAFLDDGYLVLPGFLSADDVAGGQADFYRNFPAPDEAVASPDRHADRVGYRQFPFPGEHLLRIITQPDIISFAERVIGDTDLAITNCDIWGKYGAINPGVDQPLHVDGYGSSTLAYPRTDGVYRQIMIFGYFTDVPSEDYAPTYVVSQRHTRGTLLVPPWRHQEESPELYAHQVPVLGPAGTIAVIDMSTFHRGSRLLARHGHRFLLLSGLHSRRCSWMRTVSSEDTDLGGIMDPPAVRTFLETATPRQRELLGFPAPGDEYWNELTLTGVSARYPGMNMAPYREAALAGRAETTVLPTEERECQSARIMPSSSAGPWPGCRWPEPWPVISPT